MSDEELPPALAEAYASRRPFGRGFESPRNSRRSGNGPLNALVAIYVCALIISTVLYCIAFATFSADPLGAAGKIVWANAFGGLGILGGMLHLTVAAIRQVIEDNAG